MFQYNHKSSIFYLIFGIYVSIFESLAGLQSVIANEKIF